MPGRTTGLWAGVDVDVGVGAGRGAEVPSGLDTVTSVQGPSRTLWDPRSRRDSSSRSRRSVTAPSGGSPRAQPDSVTASWYGNRHLLDADTAADSRPHWLALSR
ncbi:hypothetical protein GCM10023317_86510 [Actinopolymorpha pittospori]